MKNVEYKKMAEIEKTNWWFFGKRKILSLFLNKFIKDKNSKILDVGCGTGGIMEWLKEQGYNNIYGIDASENAIHYCKNKNIENINISNAEKMNFPDNSFDVVLAMDILEHIKDDAAALIEVKRILKNGGIAFFSVPAYSFLYSYHDKYLHHWRRYSLKSLKKSLADAGFSFLNITFTNFFLLPVLIIVRFFKTVFRVQNSDTRPTRSVVFNNILKIFYYIEIFLLKFINLPMGSSIFMVAKK